MRYSLLRRLKLGLVLNSVVIHKGHEDLFGVLLICEDVSLYELDAFIM